ncbi:hypothetical protein DXT99_10520 [Pontibacter diazotrophicus]|uniref:6-bladed beta-propeller n=1 Tax=Pontibacter diazotrophicus TaxID=1400979 RepID=A0A3D8LCD4_9BACT|nr:hypothetical protein [Pontibacter diazotrophicus]RDV15099.1 hypothetical protein DXT99_10520 [Pontibacter diazotrophicus]
MKAKVYIVPLLLVLFLTAGNAFAQQEEVTPQLVYSHSIPHRSPTSISQDRNGHLYVLDPMHNLLRLDSLGQPLDTFSPPTRGRISNIEAWSPMKILLFYEDRQTLLLLDRFLRPISSTDLRDINYEGIARAATLSSDDSFWLFDETNLTLSKLDLRLRKVTVETPLNLILDRERFDVRQLREYQNMLYLLDFNNGIYVFDNLGNYKKSIPFKGLSYIAFRGNELYFVQDGQLIFYDLYTSEKRTIALPVKEHYVTALVGDKQLYLFTNEKADIYLWQ